MTTRSRLQNQNDSKSLWNYTLSPGWSGFDAHILRLAIIKYGCGSWRDIGRHFPLKNCNQLNLQTQRLFGQQALAEFNKVNIDPNHVRIVNDEVKGFRKNQCLINTGNNLSLKKREEKRVEHTKNHGVPKELCDAIKLPLVLDPPAEVHTVIDEIEKLREMYRCIYDIELRIRHLKSNKGKNSANIKVNAKKNKNKDANKDANNEFYIYDNFDKNKDALTIMDNNLKFLNKSQREHRYIDEKACIFKIFEVGNGKYKIKSVLNDQWLAFNDRSYELIGINDESNESICFFDFEYHDDNKVEIEDNLLEPDISCNINSKNSSNIICELTYHQKQFDRTLIPNKICVEYISTKTKGTTSEYFDIEQDTCQLPHFSFRNKKIKVFYVDKNKQRISSPTEKDTYLNTFEAGTLQSTVETDYIVLTYINPKINNDESDKQLVVKFNHDQKEKYEIQLDKDKKCTIDRDMILFNYATPVEYYIQSINGEIITKTGKGKIENPYYSTPSTGTSYNHNDGKITVRFNINKSKIFEKCDLYWKFNNKSKDNTNKEFTLITDKPRQQNYYEIKIQIKPLTIANTIANNAGTAAVMAIVQTAVAINGQIQFELRLKDKRISEIWDSGDIR
eukprot:255709_1